jgi:hypothetical protein
VRQPRTTPIGIKATYLSEYRTWDSLKRRCQNPSDRSYSRYGGRGITVCDRWRDSFEAFLTDMGPRPGPGYSIDRINCRWATARQQQQNLRSNRLITFGGETKPLIVWAREKGLTKRSLQFRLNNGWPVERALTTPLIPFGQRKNWLKRHAA